MTFTLKPASPVRPSGVAHEAEAEYLTANPGEWFEVTDMKDPAAACQLAHRIKTGKAMAFRPVGHFEAQQQGCTVIARYVGA